MLRNVKKFLDLVFVELDMCPYKVVRSNCEELVLQGPEGKQDLRVVNSYPSKVALLFLWFGSGAWWFKLLLKGG